jgi:hypothetical protein
MRDDRTAVRSRTKSSARQIRWTILTLMAMAVLPLSARADDTNASSEAESALQFPNHPGVVIVPVAVSEYTDLRVQTDQVRERPSGETEQVYELEHPREGAVFLEFELHVSNDGEPWSVRPPEVRLVPLDPARKPVALRDLATESERIPLDTESVLIAGKKILYLRFEPDKEGLDDLTLWIEDAALGTVAELRSLAGAAPIETEAGTVEYPDRQ